MSILIKGMEMPKDIEPGLVIEFADGIDGKRYARLYHYQHGGLTEWLEAISIPPHGRLIDADALKNTVYAALEDAIRDDNATSYGAALCAFIAKHIVGEIEAAPTIIPAEEGQ